MNSRIPTSLPYPRLVASLVLLYLLGTAPLRAQFYQGSFIGNGTSQTISLPGVTPTFVLIKTGSSVSAQNPVLRVSGLSVSVAMANTNTYSSAITGFGPNGFSVGSDIQANESGTTMHYLAIKDVAGSIKTGTYVGNGADNRSITGIGFQPDLVWILAPGQTRLNVPSTESGSLYRTSTMTGDATLAWTNSLSTDNIQALEVDGFQVGTSVMVNGGGVTYGYLAIKNIPGFFKVLNWTGDAVAGRTLTGYGFAPDAVFSKNGSSTTTGGFKTDSTGRAVDTTLIPNATAPQANHIMALQTDGIQVGSGTRANALNGAYHGFAFKASVAVATPPPSITSSTGNLAANATTVTIAGANFDPTPSANSVTFNNGAVGTVTSGSTSSLTVTFSTKPAAAGSLTATVTNGNGSSSSTQVATVIPVVTSSAANLASTATSLTINGFGFSTTPANNTVVFTPAGTGTVTAATNTSLTVTSVSGLTAGALSAVVTSNSQSSGAAVQVATVVAAPTVSGVNSSTTNGSYATGGAISIQVTFSANVNVTGTPTLALNSGGTASYSSGSGGSTLTFNYTVAAGQNSNDLDYTNTSALALSGGTIVSSSGAVAANLTLPSPGAAGSLGANKALVIDTTAPTNTILSAAFSNDTGFSSTDFITSSTAQSLSGTLSAAMVPGESVEISLDNGSTYNTAVTVVAQNTWTLSGQTLTSSNTLRARVKDLAGNTGLIYTQAYVLDTTAPTITISAPSVSSIAAGAGSVTYTVTYSDANFNASTLTTGNITLNSIGGASGTLGVSGTGATRTVTISSIIGAGTLGISIVSATASDAAGNNAPAAGPSTTFTVLSPPSVTSISPTSGSTAGGTAVTITGTGFTGATGVTLGGTAATSVSVSNDTTITCTTPAHAAGAVSVLVTTPGGTNVANTLYTYTAPPAGAKIYFVTQAGSSTSTQTGDALWVANGDGSAATVVADNNTMKNPFGIALDLANNRAFVLDSIASASVIYSVNLTTGTPTAFLTAPTTTNYFINAIAIDSVNGYLYYTTGVPGVGVTGDSLRRIGLNGLGDTAVMDAAGTLNQPGAFALDLTNNRALICDNNTGNLRVYAVNLTTGALTTTEFAALGGTTLVPAMALDRVNNFLYWPSGVAGNPASGDAVNRISLAGTGQTTLLNNNTIQNPAAMALDLGSNRLIVADNPGSAQPTYAVDLTTGAPTVVVPSVGFVVRGVAVASPSLTTTAATSVAATSATLNGTVNANNAGVFNVSFEYGTTNAYGSTVTASPATASGNTTSGFSGAISSLTAGTLYHYRIRSNGGADVGADQTFTTASLAPTVTLTTTAVLATATSVTITGTNFNAGTPGNNTVVFSPAGTGTVTAATSTSLTVTGVTGLRGGQLKAVVTNSSGNSGAAVQVANVAPVITASTGNILPTATTLAITGFGFDPTFFANNSVAFSPAGTGNVTGSGSTSVSISGISGLTPGALNAVVTVNGVASASAQVATVLSAPTVTSINPTSGSTAGGTNVTITGTNFTGATGATVGGVALTSFSVSNATTIIGTTGAHAAGAVNVAITGSPGGASTGGTGIYTYTTPADVPLTLVVGSTLTVDATGSSGPADIRVSLDNSPGGPYIKIYDPIRTLGAPAGGTQVDSHTVLIPLSSVGSIVLNGSNQVDSFFLDFNAGDICPAGGIFVNGGLPTTTPGDSLAIDGDFNSGGSYGPGSGGSGVLVLDSSNLVTFTGLEPVDLSASSFTTFTVNVDPGNTFAGNVITTVASADAGVNTLISFGSSGLENVKLGTVTTSLTINGDTVDNDYFVLQGLGTAMVGDFVVDGQGGDADVVEVNNTTFTVPGASKNLNLKADFIGIGRVNAVAPADNPGVIVCSGNITLEADGDSTIVATTLWSGTNVWGPTTPAYFNATQVPYTQRGTIQILGDIKKIGGADATLTLKARNAIVMPNTAATATSPAGSIVSTSNKLNVIMNADSDSLNAGNVVMLERTVLTTNGGSWTVGGGSTPLTTPVTGIVGTTNTAPGVFLRSTTINTGGGDVNIRGQGAAASGGFGLVMNVSASTVGSVINSGAGNISITATGGNAASVIGLNMLGNNTGTLRSQILSSTGSITLNATAVGTSSSFGLNMGTLSEINSTGGPVNITAASIPTVIGLVLAPTSPGTATIAGGTTVTLASDTMNLNINGTGTRSVTAGGGSGTITVKPRTAGLPIDVGGGDTAGTLGLFNAELNLLNAATVNVGDATAGAIAVTAAISPSSYQTLGLISGVDTSFGLGASFTADVTSASNYEKIRVGGTVSIPAIVLFTANSAGGYVWNGTDSFTFLDNDGSDAISGTFSGPLLANFLGSSSTATASYTAGTGNDFVVGNLAPTITSVSPATGSTAGGDSVTITGTNFGGASSVTFDGNSALFTVDSATQITATTPAHSAGPVSVLVTTPGGANVANSFFTYVAANTAPTITSNGGGPTASINVAENTTAVTTVVASDTDLPAQSIAYSKSGPDAALFNISAGGVLTFATAPDFEVGPGPFSVTVTATDDGLPPMSDSQNLSVTITNKNEVPGFTVGSNQFVVAGTSTAQTVPAFISTFNDGDSTVTQSLTFNVSNDNNALFSVQPSIAPDGTLTYTPTGASGLATVTVSLTDDATIDGDAALTSATQTFTIRVNSIFLVTNANDSGIGSLRAAVADANAEPGPNTIMFSDGTGATTDFTDLVPETITLLSQINLTTPITIQGPGSDKVSVSGGGLVRVFNTSGVGPFTFQDVTIANGSAGGGAGLNAGTGAQLSLIRCVVTNNTSSGAGGGVSHSGGAGSTLALTDCTIRLNSTTGGVGAAGVSSAATTNTITGTTFANNTSASSGGAFRDATIISSTFTNCTFSNNTAATVGGAAVRYQSAGTLTMTNCTITGNRTTGAFGGAVHTPTGSTVTLTNCLIADNYTGLSPATTRADVSATVVSTSANNLIGADSGLAGITNGTNGNLIGTAGTPRDPLISALASNGGFTQTHALLETSPAVNAGTATGAPANDQRGLPRAGAVDIGAFEFQKSFSIAANQTSLAEGTGGGTTPFTFTVTRYGDLVGAASVDWAVSGAAVNAADFGGSLPSGTLNIPNATATGTITINVTQDAVAELNETFTVTLSNPQSGYIIATASASSTIDNDDLMASPEIAVEGNATDIADGDTTPSLTDHTDFGGVAVTSGTVVRTFTIKNTGNAVLNLTGTPKVAVSGTNSGDFTVTLDPTTPVAATTGTTTFQVTFDPSALGLRTATLTIANDDSDENPFDFAIQGVGAVVPTVATASPNTGTVVGGTSVVITGTGFLGTTSVTFAGVAATAFTVDSDTQITATTPAGVAGPAAVVVTTPGGSSAPPPPTSAPAIDYATATINPATSITSTRGFAFDTSSPVKVTALSYFDEGGDGLAQSHDVGIWNAAGTLLASVTVPSGTTAPLDSSGKFRFVLLPSPITLPVATGYRVGAVTLLNTPDRQFYNQTGQSLASGVSYVGGAVINNSVASLTFPSTDLSGVGGLSGGSFVVDVTPSLYTYVGSSPPEIALEGNATNIADGDTTPSLTDHTDFGSVGAAGGTVVRTFTIKNTGTGDLSLTGTPKVVVSGLNAGDFTVTTQPTSPVAATTGTTTFQVTFDPSALGLRTATLTIANDDSDEGTFDFAIQGTGVGTPDILVIGAGSNTILNGDTTPQYADGTDFGPILISGGSVPRVFRVSNTGDAALNLTGTPKVSLSDTTNFSVGIQPSSPVAVNTPQIFQILFDPVTVGVKTCTVTIASDDPDENPYTFTITGEGKIPQPVDFNAGGARNVVTNESATDGSGATDGTQFEELGRGAYMANNGVVGLPGTLKIGVGGVTLSPNNWQGYWKATGSTLSRLIRSSDAAPGAGGALLDTLPTIPVPGINPQGHVTILGALRPGSGTPAVTASNDTAMWSEVGGSGLQMLLRENDPVPGISGAFVNSFGFGCYATASFNAPAGEAALSIKMRGTTTDSALVRISITGPATSTMSVLAREKTTAPGTSENYGYLASTFSSAIRMDPQGDVVFAAQLKPSGNTGIWEQPYNGAVSKVIVAGETAPQTTATFLAVEMPSMAENKTFAFRGVLNRDGDNTANDKNDGIWMRTDTGFFLNILRRGDTNTERPGVFSSAVTTAHPNVKVGNLWNGWLNLAGVGAWRGWVDLDGDGISPYPTDTYGIYTNMGSTMSLLIASGDDAPGIAGAKMFFIDHPVVGGDDPNNGFLGFLGTVTGGGVTAGVNDKALWCSNNGNAPVLVLRTGDTMPTSQGSKIVQDIDLPGSNLEIRPWEQTVFDNTGRMVLQVKFTDGTSSQVVIPVFSASAGPM